MYRDINSIALIEDVCVYKNRTTLVNSKMLPGMFLASVVALMFAICVGTVGTVDDLKHDRFLLENRLSYASEAYAFMKEDVKRLKRKLQEEKVSSGKKATEVFFLRKDLKQIKENYKYLVELKDKLNNKYLISLQVICKNQGMTPEEVEAKIKETLQTPRAIKFLKEYHTK